MPNELVEGIVSEFRAEVERYFRQVEEWKKKGAAGGLEGWEERVRELVQPIQRKMVEGVVEAVGKGYEGPQQRCRECGQWARYVGDRPHRIRTLVGSLKEVRRAYYHGCGCGGGWFPQDRKLKLDAQGRSEGLRRVVSLMGAVSPYEKATDYLWEVGRIPVSRTTVERVTEEVGTEVEHWLKKREQEGGAGLRGLTQAGPARVYVETDGTTALTREGWKEVKLGVAFVEEEGGRRKTEYTAGFEGAEEFVVRLRGLAGGLGALKAKEVVVLADGAEWIWKRVPEVFKGPVVEIVDWFHAKERLWEGAHLVFGEKSPQGQEWAQIQTDKLWRGEVEEVIEALQALRPKSTEAKDFIRQSIGYYQENAHRMKYEELQRRGYLVGSGVIESGCKHVVGQRLKQAGMRWNQEHAQKVLSLRVCRASRLWDEYWSQASGRGAA